METKTTTGITFQVEELERAKDKLGTKSFRTIMQCRVQEDLTGEILDDAQSIPDPDFPSHILATSKINTPLVDYGYHPFFSSMYQAFAQHRPFVFSPDILWLLISQGFAQHVNNNAEALRHHFVNFSGKMKLINEDQDIYIYDPDAPWEKMFPAFIAKIKEQTGAEFIEDLSAGFSTTGPDELIASQITIMDSVKSYFEFIQMYIVCGIPEITLEGAESDWRHLREKAAGLRKYELDWWIDSIDPLLEQFVAAAGGKPDTEFWQTMFKIKTQWWCGEAGVADGWILNFFPYDADGNKRSGPINIYRNSGESLPKELVKVDVKYIIRNPVDSTDQEIPLEVWAGFVGAEQNPETLALRPKIGWMIRKKDEAGEGMVHQLEKEVAAGNEINISVDNIPEEIIKVKKIDRLGLYFKDHVKIPDAMKDMKIRELSIEGKISSKERFRVLRFFPASWIYINNSRYPPFLPFRFPGIGAMRYPMPKLYDYWRAGRYHVRRLFGAD